MKDIKFWFGVVEDIEDPLQLFRCRVRVAGYHSAEKTEVPTTDLPWAQPIHSLDWGPYNRAEEGDMVFGFFADGEDAQYPMMLGIVPGIPQQPANSSKGFNDPRTPAKLAERPRPPSEIIKSQTTVK